MKRFLCFFRVLVLCGFLFGVGATVSATSIPLSPAIASSTSDAPSTVTPPSTATTDSLSDSRQPKTIFRGYEGGMMLHTGYLYGGFPQIGYPVSGAAVGIGGLIKIRLGNHWRVGTEGYASTLPQLKNGSYSRFGWGGLLGDFYWTFGRFSPYVGLTIGGGVNSNLIILDPSRTANPWSPLENSYFNRRGFFAIAPFVGCDFAVTDFFHLSLKADWLNCVTPSAPVAPGSPSTQVSSAQPAIPTGPRFYIGFIFCH